jgi:hypothetical protein
MPQRRLAQPGLEQQRQHEHEAAEEEQKGEALEPGFGVGLELVPGLVMPTLPRDR